MVLAGDSAATLALARHGGSVLLRVAHQAVAAAGLADAVVALRTGAAASSTRSRRTRSSTTSEIDGPLPERVRVLALTLAAERPVVAARVAGLDDVDLVGAEDVPEVAVSRPPYRVGSRAEQQLAVLAVRLEMAAVYLRLVRG